MGTILRIVILLWPFLKEIIKGNSSGRLKKGNRFDKTMMMMCVVMFLLFLYISDHAFKFAKVVERQREELTQARVLNEKKQLATERLASVLSVTREQVSIQKNLLEQYRDKNEQLITAIALQKEHIIEQNQLLQQCRRPAPPAPKVEIPRIDDNVSSVLDRLRKIRESEYQ